MLSSGSSRRAKSHLPGEQSVVGIIPILFTRVKKKAGLLPASQYGVVFLPRHGSVAGEVGAASRIKGNLVKVGAGGYEECSQASFPHAAECRVRNLVTFWFRKLLRRDRIPPKRKPQLNGEPLKDKVTGISLLRKTAATTRLAVYFSISLRYSTQSFPSISAKRAIPLVPPPCLLRQMFSLSPALVSEPASEPASKRSWGRKKLT